jgi:hypothetical protein
MNLEAQLIAVPAEGGDIAFALFPEAKILADDDGPDGRGMDQDFFDEVPGAEVGEPPVEGYDQGRFDADVFDALQALFEGLDHADLVRPKNFFRMRGEGQDTGEELLAFGLPDQEFQDFLVSQMQAVEVPDGQGRMPGETGELFEGAEDLHGFTA